MSTRPARRRLQVGLIGLGRLGRVYARDLSTRIVETRLAAVADTNATAAKDIAAEWDVPAWYGSADELIADPNVDAVIVVSPTHTHRDVVMTAAERRKPIFCEKPLALSLSECREMEAAVERQGTFFQMGFMRRFDPGYAAAKRHVEEGHIGRPVVVDLTRNGIYGYDIVTELLGTEGTMRIGYIQETPVTMMTKNAVAHDTVPHFMERFERAYTRQLQDFAQNVLTDREPPVRIRDGIEALRVGLAAVQACRSGVSVRVSSIQ